MAATGTRRKRRRRAARRRPPRTAPPPTGPTTWLGHLLACLWACVRPRAGLVVENLLLRQQLVVQQRSVPRPRFTNRDRLFWLVVAMVVPRWREALAIAKPDTVLRWQRKGWRAYWRWRSRPSRIGRPPIGWKLVRLIHRLSRENPLWGPERIASELRLLGHEVGESTVARYMAKRRRPRGGQSWMTFLRNHMAVTAACDYFMVPTVTFRCLFVFVVLSHDRRVIRHVGVTAHPTAEWTARQLREAFPGGDEPRLLLRDNDSIFGDEFTDAVRTMAIRELHTGYRSPWQNCFVERVIGTLRRECTDHLLVLGEQHLERALREYVERYYNPARPHMSLDGNSPVARIRETTPGDDIIGTAAQPDPSALWRVVAAPGLRLRGACPPVAARYARRATGFRPCRTARWPRFYGRRSNGAAQRTPRSESVPWSLLARCGCIEPAPTTTIGTLADLGRTRGWVLA